VVLERTRHLVGAVGPQARAPLDVSEEEGDHRAPLLVGPRGGRGRSRSALRDSSEARIVGEDAVLEVDELLAGFDAQPLEEQEPHLLVGPDGIGLPTTAVQRQHEERPEPFVERMGADQGLQLGSRLPRPSEIDEGIAAALQRLEVQGLEPCRLAVRPRALELPQGWAPPQLERLVEHCEAASGVGLGAGRRHRPIEAGGVYRRRVELEHVAPGSGVEAHIVAVEQLAQLGHVGLHGADRTGATVAPQLAHQAVGADRLARVGDQVRQQAPPLHASQFEASGRTGDLERAKDPKVHRHTLLSPVIGSRTSPTPA